MQARHQKRTKALSGNPGEFTGYLSGELCSMNDTDYGLTASVYTKDERRARKLLARVNAGTAYWNCCDRVSPRLPWSGVKHSGIGLTLSTYGIQTFTRPKAWHLRSA